MADLSLKIAVKLLTKNFHQGVNSLKGSIKSLQMQFFALSSALGAGTVGMSNLISKMRETAKETSAVNIALKNVSGTTAQFADNQKWLLSVAGKYGVQINTLTSGFTKFKAAADIANMSADDQRKIFESVSRASVAYALSAEDQRGVFMALAQMMSKGKVMAEELRLQMAERLPVAIQAMAKAMGVSVNQMDAMMKQGKVLSSEVLPKFAEALTEMTPNIDLDNLNKSLSELSNSFVRLGKAFDIEGKYKAIVDKLGGALSWLADHADKVATAIRIAFEGLVAFKGFKIFAGFAAETEKSVSAAQRLMDNLTKKVADEAEKQKRVASAKADYEAALNAESALTVEATEAQKTKAHTHTTNTFNALKKRELDYEKSVEARKRVEAKITEDTRKTLALSGVGTFRKAYEGLIVVFKRVGVALKAAFSAAVITAAITVVIDLIARISKAISEWNRLNKLVDETEKKLNQTIDVSSQEQDLSANLRLLRSKNSSDKQREGALVKINSLLGTEYKLTDLTNEKMKEINEKAARYTSYLQAQARLENAKSVHRERKAEFDALVQEYAPGLRKRGVMKGKSDEAIASYIRYNPHVAKGGESIVASLVKAEQGLEKWSSVVSKYSAEFESSFNAESPVVGGGGAITNDGKSPLAKAQKEYSDSLAELDTELRAQLITEREYTRKKRDLIEKSYVDALGGGDAETLGSAWFASLSKEFGSFAHGDLRKRQEGVEDMLTEYRNNLRELNRQHEAGAFAPDEYRDAIRQLALAFYREAGALDLSGLPDRLIQEVLRDRIMAGQTTSLNAASYKPLERNHRTWDMSASDFAAENLAEAENYLAYLVDTAKSTAVDMTSEINAQLAHVDSLKNALKLEEAKEAVEELSKELARGGWEMAKGAVSGLDGIVSAVERVSEVMNDTDASGWERIMAIWDAMTSMVDGFMEMIEMIETMKEVTEKLTKAKEVEGNIENMNSQNKMQNISSEMAASAAQATQEVADAGTVIGAKTGEAVAAGTAQGAKAGWPALLWAIPAALAAVMAGLAMIPKFAQGGVVGGNSKHGDKVLARLNSGEGVLTEKGMANLAGLAGAKASNINVTGRLKAHGRDLLVVLEQEKRYQRRTK